MAKRHLENFTRRQKNRSQNLSSTLGGFIEGLVFIRIDPLLIL